VEHYKLISYIDKKNYYYCILNNSMMVYKTLYVFLFNDEIDEHFHWKPIKSNISIGKILSDNDVVILLYKNNIISRSQKFGNIDYVYSEYRKWKLNNL